MDIYFFSSSLNRIATVTLVACTLGGCFRARVERAHPNERIDISGYWNDTDSRLTAEEMIYDCLSQTWLPAFTSRLHKFPTLIIGTISNESSEHININSLVEEFQRALINSKQVTFVASPSERERIREERADQMGNSPDINQKSAEEISADYILSGVIGSVVDQDSKRRVVYYQVNLKLLDIKSNMIVWNGQKKIKKLIGRPGDFW